MKPILLILDLIICTGSFFGVYYFKTNSFIPKIEYLILFNIFICLWIAFSIYYKKYKCAFSLTFRAYYRSLFISSSITLLFLVLIVALTDLKIVSRLFLISIIAIPSILELLFVSILRWWLPSNSKIENNSDEISDVTETMILKLKWLVTGLGLLITVFFILIRYKTGEFVYYPWSEKILLIIIVSWLLSIGLTGKYRYIPSQNLYYQIAPFVKSGIIMLIMAGAFYFFFHQEHLSRQILFGTIIIYAILENLVFSLLLLDKRRGHGFMSNKNISNNGDGDIFGQRSLSVDPQIDISLKLFDIRALFERVSFQESDNIVKFILQNCKGSLGRNSATLLSTRTIDNINVLPDRSQTLLMNLHLLNDIRRLNKYMIACSDKIKPGGMLFGCFIPLARDRQRLRSKMPRLIFKIIYPFYFMFYRILPKLPKIRHLYFVLTKGKGRVVSKAEIFGRLSFCGYKVTAEIIIDNTLYFMAHKLSTISTEKEPSYSSIVRLKRIGLNGNLINIYKFRTMHPYSEFIQKEIFEHNSLDPSGKIKDDFRLTNWGIILRKLWIDELPQLYNWIRGDITLVGVRALSEHYFSLYPKDLQELRTSFKPGLIPPYYADMPKEFNEVIESERRYLQRKQEKEYSTDFIYLWKAFYNILFKGARSY